MSRKQEMLKPGLLDRGTFAGSFAAALVLAGWLIVEFGHGSHAAETHNNSTGTEKAVEPVSKSDNPAPPAAAKAPAVPAWKLDLRWGKANDLGEDGLEQVKKALRWKEEKGGDPFYFAAQIDEAGEKVSKALRIFQAMRVDFEGQTAAVSAIDKKIRYFEERQPRRRK
jgi:hypothetical protein